MRNNGSDSFDYINKLTTAFVFVVLKSVCLLKVGQGLPAFVFNL